MKFQKAKSINDTHQSPQNGTGLLLRHTNPSLFSRMAPHFVLGFQLGQIDHTIQHIPGNISDHLQHNLVVSLRYMKIYFKCATVTHWQRASRP